jgi:hypothetical protein
MAPISRTFNGGKGVKMIRSLPICQIQLRLTFFFFREANPKQADTSQSQAAS